LTVFSKHTKIHIPLTKQSCKLIKNEIKNIIRDSGLSEEFKETLSKSISDASWNKLRQFSTYKAENAGKLLITVNPHGTTQRCSNCKN